MFAPKLLNILADLSQYTIFIWKFQAKFLHLLSKATKDKISIPDIIKLTPLIPLSF